MDFINLLPAGDRDELREWLMENHDKENECCEAGPSNG